MLSQHDKLTIDWKNAKTISHLAELLELNAKNEFNVDCTITFSNLFFNKKVSNTHSAPKGMLTNFRQTLDRPRYYPGIVGRVHIYERNHKSGTRQSFFSNVVDASGVVHTGTGGGGYIRKVTQPNGVLRSDATYAYDVTIWLDDFLELSAWIYSGICLGDINKTGDVTYARYSMYRLSEFFDLTDLAPHLATDY